MNITTIVDYELTTEEAAILSAYLHRNKRAVPSERIERIAQYDDHRKK